MAISAFSLALVIGAMITAIAAWILSGLTFSTPRWVTGGLILAAGAAAILRDFGIIRFPLPERHQLIPESVFEKGIVRAAWRFGVELGTGVRTRVPTAGPYFLVLCIVLYGQDVPQALMAGLGFGAGRAAMALLRYWSRGGDTWDMVLARRLAWLSSASTAIAVPGLAVVVLARGL